MHLLRVCIYTLKDVLWFKRPHISLSLDLFCTFEMLPHLRFYRKVTNEPYFLSIRSQTLRFFFARWKFDCDEGSRCVFTNHDQDVSPSRRLFSFLSNDDDLFLKWNLLTSLRLPFFQTNSFWFFSRLKFFKLY